MSSYPEPPSAAYHGGNGYAEKPGVYDEKDTASPVIDEGRQYDIQEGGNHDLARNLKSRHMQMIAIGGAIGAGYFVGTGTALQSGGPASLVICYIIVGTMLLFTMQALAELGVMFPVNGAFFQYAMRFIDKSWGFAVGWDYALSWLTVLPFEITAAGITIGYWPKGAAVNIGVWITVFLVALSIIQVFGVRGYGEVEFVLSTIKVTACLGFILLAIIIDCGGVPTDDRGYIGAKYWYDPGAFRNGFKGFCSVFVVAAFAFGGTELTGLAAAEAANPVKSIPQATKQVFWRITFFYVLGLFLIGLVVPSNNDQLLNSTGANTKASPFVLAIELAGIKGLPSVMNVVITISVLSVANSCTFGSTRTIQALAAHGMAPKFLAYVDKAGRPIPCVILQLIFGLVAFANEASSGGATFFDWLLALSGLAYFFIWGSICFAHIRFRAGWKAQGHTLDEIPYLAAYGTTGSWIGLFLCFICIAATFYNSLYDAAGDPPSAYAFFEAFLAAPVILVLYLGWKIYTRDTNIFISAMDMDVTTGIRHNVAELRELAAENKEVKTWANLPKRFISTLI